MSFLAINPALSPGTGLGDSAPAQARTILHHLLEGGDIAGSDAVGRTVITLAVHDWLLEQLLRFDAAGEELEDNGDAEPEDDAE